MNKRIKSNSIRIIAGRWRGRKLPVLDSDGLRPTTDRVRETLFNWLMYDVSEARCLDLFAGTGALGFECLSRGAAHVTFVESQATVCDALKQNLLTLDAEGRGHVVKTNGVHFLETPPKKAYDLVFLDPPFDSELLGTAIEKLSSEQWLTDSALVYVEQSSKSAEAKVPEQWSLHKEGVAGHSRYRLYAV